MSSRGSSSVVECSPKAITRSQGPSKITRRHRAYASSARRTLRKKIRERIKNNSMNRRCRRVATQLVTIGCGCSRHTWLAQKTVKLRQGLRRAAWPKCPKVINPRVRQLQGGASNRPQLFFAALKRRLPFALCLPISRRHTATTIREKLGAGGTYKKTPFLHSPFLNFGATNPPVAQASGQGSLVSCGRFP